MPFPFIYTFYSFKGGVGRSMALINVAYALAGKGRHVLMVDMDLEAPGISGFLERTRELDPAKDHDGDVLNLLAQGVSLIQAASPTEEMLSQLPPLESLIQPILTSKLEPLKPKFGELGRLDLLPIRMDAGYGERLANTGLKDLSDDKLAELSDLLHSWFKSHRFLHKPYGLEDFEAPVKTPYDYVLVDSRTGITEIGGLCVGPLADRLVVLTGLNDQNIQGTRDFLEMVGIRPVPRPLNDEPWDEADPVALRRSEQKTLGPKPTIIVATPAPAGEILLKRKRFAALRKATGLEPLQLSYHPQMALQETNFVRDFLDEPLAIEYRRLTVRVMEQINDDSASVASRFQQEIKEESHLVTAMQLALRVAPDQQELGGALLMQAGNEAIRVRLSPHIEPRRVHAHLAQDSDSVEAALYNWGIVLSDEAKENKGEEADRLYAAAYEKYGRALAIKPDKHEALHNWGTALSHQAKEKKGEESDRLYVEACEKYERALAIKPEFHEALNNWGLALLAQAKVKGGQEADHLFSAARGRFLRVEQILPGTAAYNLACLESLVGNTREAIQWIERSHASGRLPSRAKLSTDSDLDPIRSLPEFQEFLDSLK